MLNSAKEETQTAMNLDYENVASAPENSEMLFTEDSTSNVENNDLQIQQTLAGLSESQATDCTDTINPNFSNSEKHVWKYNETLALIHSMQTHHDDLNHPKKRKHVYENIANELISLGFNVTAVQCQVKWKSLVRTYTTTKDNKNKTGRGPTRFQFLEEIYSILGTKPSNQCDHSLESSEETKTDKNNNNEVIEGTTSSMTTVSEQSTDNEAVTDTERDREKGRGTHELVPTKKRRRNENYLKEKQKKDDEKKAKHRERMEIEKEKINLEREQIALFREYLQRKK